jgi:hypothetical protein
MIKIDFEFTTQYGVFRDALYLEDDHQLTANEIDTLKQERLNSWLSIIENPPEPAPETVEIDGIIYEKVNVNGETLLKPLVV